MTRDELRAAVRRMLGGPPVDQFPNAWIDEQLQHALEALNRRIGFYVKDDTSITTANGTGEYTLPADVVEIVWVLYGSSFLDRSDQDEWRRRGIDWRSTAAGTPGEYAHFGGKIILYPKPDAAQQLTIRYVATPPALPSSGPDLLPTQDHRILAFYAAGVLQLTHRIENAPVDPKGLLELFEREAGAIRDQYRRRATGLLA